MTTKDIDALLTAQGVPSSERSQSQLRAILTPLTKGSLRSAKVMLDLERKRGGVSQSRGYGFVEFREHSHALACLRELNNNPAYGSSAAGATSKSGQKPRLIAEFSLENMQKVKLLKAREERALKRKAELAVSNGGVDEPKTKKAKGLVSTETVREQDRDDEENDEIESEGEDDGDENESGDSQDEEQAAPKTKKRRMEDGPARSKLDDKDRKKANKLRRKEVMRKRKEKVETRKRKAAAAAAGGGGATLAVASTTSSTATASGQEKKKKSRGLFARIREEKKNKQKKEGGGEK